MAIQVTRPKTEFIDDRGAMKLVVGQSDFPIKSVLIITSKAGTVRGNHYHKNGFHYYYVESGKCEYWEKPVNKPTAKIEAVILGPGDLINVRPMVINATKFLEDSVIYHFDTERREQSQYESNTVRVKLM